MDNKFFTFIKPYLTYIDNGHLYRKPFSWLYAVIAILNFLAPVYILFTALDNEILGTPGKFIFVFLVVWVILVFASWISFQLWWDRRSKVNFTSSDGDEFVVTPVFCHFIQTAGEWAGTWLAIVGTLISLLVTIILGDEGYYFSQSIGIPFLETGFIFIFLMPVYGFLIIVGSRFLAEQFKALSVIANNSKKN